MQVLIVGPLGLPAPKHGILGRGCLQLLGVNGPEEPGAGEGGDLGTALAAVLGGLLGGAVGGDHLIHALYSLQEDVLGVGHDHHGVLVLQHHCVAVEV